MVEEKNPLLSVMDEDEITVDDEIGCAKLK